MLFGIKFTLDFYYIVIPFFMLGRNNGLPFYKVLLWPTFPNKAFGGLSTCLY